MSLLLWFASGGGGAPATPDYPVFTINAADRTSNVSLPTGIDIEYSLGGRAIARLQTKDTTTNSTATAYSPDIDQSVLVTFNSATLFSGTVISKTIDALAQPAIGVGTQIEAIDYSSYLDHRLVEPTTFPGAAGWTTETLFLHIINTYLTGTGITLSSALGTPVTFTDDIVIDNLTVRAALNRIALLSNWIWRLTPSKVVEGGPVGTYAASYTLTSTNSKIVGGVRWNKQRTKYANRVRVRYGGERVVQKRFNATGNSVTASWTLDETPILQTGGEVQSLGNFVEFNGVDTLYYPLYHPLTPYSVNAATKTITRTSALPTGSTVYWDYAAQFPSTVTVEDAAEIAARGRYDLLIDADDITDRSSATTLANAELTRQKAMPREVTVATSEGMEFPGTRIDLTVPERDLSGSWLITDVRVRNLDGIDNRLLYEFTCLEGSTAQETWIERAAAIFGGGSSGSAVGQFTGGLVPAASGVVPTDVVANAGMNTPSTGACESSLRGAVFPGQGTGPAVMVGRPDDTHTWALMADQLDSGTGRRRLAFIPWNDKSVSAPWAMALEQHPSSPVSGEYYLVPYTSKTLFVGGPSAVYGGNTNRVQEVHAKHVNIGSITGKATLLIAGPSGQWTADLTANSTTSNSFGLRVDAGTNTSDAALRVRDATGVNTYFEILGNGDINVPLSDYELGRTTKRGYWISVAHNDANFTGDATGNADWVVDSADQITFKYRIIGKSMLVSFTLSGTDVANSPTELRIAIPGSHISSARMDTTMSYVDAGGTPAQGQCYVEATGGFIKCVKNGNVAWTNTSSDNTNIVGQIEFEIV